MKKHVQFEALACRYPCGGQVKLAPISICKYKKKVDSSKLTDISP